MNDWLLLIGFPAFNARMLAPSISSVVPSPLTILNSLTACRIPTDPALGFPIKYPSSLSLPLMNIGSERSAGADEGGSKVVGGDSVVGTVGLDISPGDVADGGGGGLGGAAACSVRGNAGDGTLSCGLFEFKVVLADGSGSRSLA
jgi:hypothetical protein